MPLIVTPRQLVQRAQFYRQLSQLTAAGIPIISALDMLSRNPPSRALREPALKIIAQVSAGSTLSEGIAQLGNWIPTFDLALIEAGEKSGRLDAIFRMLANYYDDRAAMVRKILGDLLYPAFLFHFCVVIFAFIKWFQGGEGLFGLAFDIFKFLLPAYVLVFVIIFAAQGKHGLKWRSFLERVLHPVPMLGSARHCLALARLSAALEALINAGVSIVEAWEMAAQASGSPAMCRVVTAWRPQVNAGHTPSEVVNTARSQFPELFANLYRTGEVSGQLDDSLRRLHVYYQEQGTSKLHTLATVVPKAIYLMVAGFIAYHVINFYTGYFHEINQLTK